MANRSEPLVNKGKQNPNYDKTTTPSHGNGKLNGGNANKYYTNVEYMLPLVTQWVQEGKTDEQIYNALGISSASWYRYKEEQPELQKAIRDGKSVLVMRFEAKACEKIFRDSETDYKHDSLQMFMMKKNSPDKYSDKNDKATDMPVGTIDINIQNVSMSDEDREAVVADVVEERKKNGIK